MTIVACAGGPLALAVLRPRSKKRDVALYALQMWAFIMVHELPYDDPEGLRARLRSRYPIVVDRAIGGGRLPNARLQRALARLPRVGAIDRFLTWAHWLWFFEPYLALALILVRHNDALPARGAPDGRGLRRRLRRLLRASRRRRPGGPPSRG